jgi:hypothetical protein
MLDEYKLSRATNYGAWKFRMREMLWHLILPNPLRIIMEQDLTTTFQKWQIRALAIINLSMKDEIIFTSFNWTIMTKCGMH